jgi:hypothetical protein
VTGAPNYLGRSGVRLLADRGGRRHLAQSSGEVPTARAGMSIRAQNYCKCEGRGAGRAGLFFVLTNMAVLQTRYGRGRLLTWQACSRGRDRLGCIIALQRLLLVGEERVWRVRARLRESLISGE